MNELDYAQMIEIPVNSCDVTYKKPKRFFKRKKSEELKQELIRTVNDDEPVVESTPVDYEDEANTYETVEVTTKAEEKKRNKRRLTPDVITAQVAVIIVLALTIMLTNIFWQDSGINSLVKGVFASPEVVEDKVYTEFAPLAPSRTAEVELDGGVMTFSSAGSVYPVCDGTITKVAENAGKYDISIQYSTSFSALISGADYAYYGQGDTVYSSVPVCYSGSGEVKVYLYNDGKLLTDYTVDNGKIVWLS